MPEARMLPNIRQQFINAIADRSPLLALAKWSGIAFAGMCVSGFIAAKISAGLGVAFFFTAVAGCVYGRYREWNRVRQQKRQLAAYDDQQLRSAYEDFLAVGGKPRPRGVTPGAWAGIACLGTLAVVTVVAAQSQLRARRDFHSSLVAAYQPVKQELTAIADGQHRNFSLPAQRMEAFCTYLDNADPADMSSDYRAEFARFKELAREWRQELKRLPNMSDVAGMILFALREGINNARTSDKAFERLQRSEEAFVASFKRLNELATF